MPRADEVIDAVVRRTGVSKLELLGPERTSRVVRARQLTAYLLRELAGQPYERIALRLARHHTTALHGYKRVRAKLAERDPFITQVVEEVGREFPKEPAA